MDNCEEFARRLVEARDQRELTQTEAARQMGMSAATLSMLERTGNVGTARFKDILGVCRFYGWPLEEVVSLCFEGIEPAEGLPPNVSLLVRALPQERKQLLFNAIEAMARGLGD